MIIVTLGDVFGYAALALISLTAVFMLIRRRILRYTKNLDLLRRIHIFIAASGGLFLVLHVAFFVGYPITLAVGLGYISAAIATFVWLTGTAFLERFRDALFFHGTMSLTALGLMVAHSASAGINIPFWIAELLLVSTTGVVFFRASKHAEHAIREI